MITTGLAVPAPQRRARSSSPTALLIVDVDGCAAFRGSTGHVAAETVLASVATVVRDCLGANGTVRRCGGDGFLALLPGVAAVPARHLAERACTSVAALAVPGHTSGGSQLGDGISVSIGGAVHDGARLDVAMLFWCADAALYEVKRAGGDAVRIVDPGDTRR